MKQFNINKLKCNKIQNLNSPDHSAPTWTRPSTSWGTWMRVSSCRNERLRSSSTYRTASRSSSFPTTERSPPSRSLPPSGSSGSKTSLNTSRKIWHLFRWQEVIIVERDFWKGKQCENIFVVTTELSNFYDSSLIKNSTLGNLVND